jgi:hypothetical protein
MNRVLLVAAGAVAGAAAALAAVWLIDETDLAWLRVEARPCSCGHEREAHEHHRAGADCSLCGCPRFDPNRETGAP